METKDVLITADEAKNSNMMMKRNTWNTSNSLTSVSNWLQ